MKYLCPMKIAVIGAGPAGMMAALQAAWTGVQSGAASGVQSNVQVVLFDRNPLVGRKLLVTGSGRCNITNAFVSAARYTCGDPRWIEALLGAYGHDDLVATLAEIGIPVMHTDDGWFYPVSQSAQSVSDSFASALEQAGVETRLLAVVRDLRRAQDLDGVADQGFELEWHAERAPEEAPDSPLWTRHSGREHFDRVIVAAGGMAYPAMGSRGELFPLLERLGIRVDPKRPALTPITAEMRPWKPLQGIRLDIGARLIHRGEELGHAEGNMIFTEWGVNGPAAMDLGHLVSARPGQELDLLLDPMAPHATVFGELLARKRGTGHPVRALFGAVLPPKLVTFQLQSSGIALDTKLSELPGAALDRLVGQFRCLRLKVTGTRGFDHSHISAGGVSVLEANPLTCEAKGVPGLFLVGETLDVIGPCGGHNIQHAFSSGAVAGRAAALPRLTPQ
jgi:predicted flavoprotein YhiN